MVEEGEPVLEKLADVVMGWTLTLGNPWVLDYLIHCDAVHRVQLGNFLEQILEFWAEKFLATILVLRMLLPEDLIIFTSQCHIEWILWDGGIEGWMPAVHDE